MKILMLLGLLFVQKPAFAETYHCESEHPRADPVPVFLSLKLEGGVATADITVANQEARVIGVATPWHNSVPNRCASQAEGYDLDFKQSEIKALHVVTRHSGNGCFMDSFLSVNGVSGGQGINLICTAVGGESAQMNCPPGTRSCLGECWAGCPHR